MTNEEKAQEIGKVNARQYRHNYGGNEFIFSDNECIQFALEMAEWKDQQFKEYLNKRITQDIKNQNDALDREHEDAALFYGARRQAYESIINELFKED